MVEEFAAKAFAFDEAESDFRVELHNAGVPFKKIGWDWYDCSLEIHGVKPEARLDDRAQQVIHGAGFAKAYVNHTDKWETHYSWKRNAPFSLSFGWRVRYGHKAEPEVKHIEVEKFPDGWPSDWLESGYVRVIPTSTGSAAS